MQTRAKGQLRRYRQGSILAVAITAFLLLFWEANFSQAQTNGDETAEAASSAMVSPAAPTAPGESVEQAAGTIRSLLVGFYAFLPKLFIALLILLVGWVVSRLIRGAYRHFTRGSQKGAGFVALLQIGLFFTVVVAALSVLVGDARALLGSLGLVGLALSWALQTPIESFTGWVLNTFRSYYRVGDRIEVGEVFGDVYKIDVLTTTVWEAGGPGKPVAGAQPTGALITFPNSEVLRANIINYSRDFPFVWDEVVIGIANESDLSYAIQVIRSTAEKVIGPNMAASIESYRQLLIRNGLDYDIDDKPQVYLSPTDSWTNCIVRYLVGVRSRRKWASRLVEVINTEISRPEHKERILQSYPRQEIVFYGDKQGFSPQIRKERREQKRPIPSQGPSPDGPTS